MTWIKRGSASTVEEVFLHNIGAGSLDEINGWFQRSYDDGYFIDGLDEAVTLALTFTERPVTIIGDYDGDGMTSTAILYRALTRAGFTDVHYRIPRRFSEGFGINPVIIDEIPEGLVITCDNGIGQREVIHKAKEKGLAVIVLDHHLPDTDGDKILLPPADVVVDPHAIPGSAAFNDYCGAGLCYRFAKVLLARTGRNEKAYIDQLMGLAAIGTVTDVMPLKEENYVIVRNGLKVLLRPELNSAGLRALIATLGLSVRITAHDIGFKLGPALNAASRLKDDGAAEAVGLLLFDGGAAEAAELATGLIRTNDRRKLLQNAGRERARDLIRTEGLSDDYPMVVYLPETPEGIVGTIAGNLCEEFGVPVIVMTDKEGDPSILKGSARSVAGYHMKHALDKVAPLLNEYGGHEGAAGLSFEKAKLGEIRDSLKQQAKGPVMSKKDDQIYYDLEISADQIPAYAAELKRFEPFGEGNPAVVFRITDYRVVPFRGAYKTLLGAGQSIVKFYSDGVQAIGFGLADRLEHIREPHVLDLVGCLTENIYNGHVEDQIEFMDCEQKS